MKDAAQATHSLVGSLAAQELNGHCPRRSKTFAHRRFTVHAVDLCAVGICYAGILKFSPRLSAAQANRAFFDAMATTAFQ